MALASFRLEVSEIRRRTAAIWSPKTSSKPAQSGTGIWIGGNLLLTAHHVCVSDRVHYRWAGETEWVEEASVIQRDVDLDVAVVEVTPRSPPAQETSIWFSCPTARELEATAMGYPSFQKPDTKILELDDIGGKCRPAAGRDGILRMVTSRHYASAKEDDWKGVSGAGLFLEDVLAGVVIEAKPNGLDARTLEDIRRKESPIWGLIKPYVVDHMQQPSIDVRAHDLELWLEEDTKNVHQHAIRTWLFRETKKGSKPYSRSDVEKRFCELPLDQSLHTTNFLVEKLNPLGSAEAKFQARRLLFNLLPLHRDGPSNYDEIGFEFREALRLQAAIDLERAKDKIIAPKALRLRKGLGSETIAAIEGEQGLMQYFVDLVAEEKGWTEQRAIKEIVGDVDRYLHQVRYAMKLGMSTALIRRPFFISISEANEAQQSIIEALQRELNIGVYVDAGTSIPLKVLAALDRAFDYLGYTEETSGLESQTQDSPT